MKDVYSIVSLCCIILFIPLMDLQKHKRKKCLPNSRSIFAPSTLRRALRWCSSVTWPESRLRRCHGNATVTSSTWRRPTTRWRRSAARAVWRSNAPRRTMPASTRARRPTRPARRPPAPRSTLSVSRSPYLELFIYNRLYSSRNFDSNIKKHALTSTQKRHEHRHTHTNNKS